jgi:2-phospho-L-lactate transferase/gluconeogenesis factor (CofD/UPF0052 family)
MAISQATTVSVSTVATPRGETDGFSVGDHFETLVRHIGPGLFDYVLANDNVQGPLPEAWQSNPVSIDNPYADGARVITADVVSEANRYHHDPEKLAAAIMRLFGNRAQVEAAEELATVRAAR